MVWGLGSVSGVWGCDREHLPSVEYSCSAEIRWNEGWGEGAKVGKSGDMGDFNLILTVF